MELNELKQLIVDSHDELMIIELLRITPQDLVEAFTDRIEDNQDRLVRELMGEETVTED